MPTWIVQLTELLALPEYGLSTVFVVSFISATLLPMGSEPVVFGLVKLNPELFWPAVLVATAGNTLGGALDWWMGYGANKVVGKYKHSSQHNRALRWLEKLGPKACLLAWLPAVVTRCARWQVGSNSRSGPAWFTWPLASFYATC
jgi:membrane protein YqaA with SNARE-associated domain